jgi:hypothetical protein
MRTTLSAFAFLAAALSASLALPAAAEAAGWALETGTAPGTATLGYGTPITDRDAFRLDCAGGKLVLSTWAASPPRGITEGNFATRLSVFFGNRELVFDANGRVTGPGGGTRIDAKIPDPRAFVASLDTVRRLTTVIFAGRRMTVAPKPSLTAAFRKACDFQPVAG